MERQPFRHRHTPNPTTSTAPARAWLQWRTQLETVFQRLQRHPELLPELEAELEMQLQLADQQLTSTPQMAQWASATGIAGWVTIFRWRLEDLRKISAHQPGRQADSAPAPGNANRPGPTA